MVLLAQIAQISLGHLEMCLIHRQLRHQLLMLLGQMDLLGGLKIPPVDKLMELVALVLLSPQEMIMLARLSTWEESLVSKAKEFQ